MPFLGGIERLLNIAMISVIIVNVAVGQDPRVVIEGKVGYCNS